MSVFSSTDPLVGAHINYYRHLLSGRQPVKLSRFIPTYLQMQPLLHNLASSPEFDLPALKYSATRLPEIINLVKKVIISQNQSDFDNHDVFHDIGKSVAGYAHRCCTLRRRIILSAHISS